MNDGLVSDPSYRRLLGVPRDRSFFLFGLRPIADLSGLKRRIVVYVGMRPQRTEDGIDVLPAKAFVEALQSHAVW